MAGKGAQDKTEKATPKRRQDARKKGQVAKSQELPSVAVLMAGISTLAMTVSVFHERLTSLMRHVFSQVGTIQVGDGNGMALFHDLIFGAVILLAPLFGVVFVVAVLVNLFQVGPLLTFEPIKPKFSKLNPFKGLKRIFSMKTVFELFKNLMKLVLVGYIAYLTIEGEWENLPKLSNMALIEAIKFMLTVALRIFLRCCLALIILAIIDFMFQKFQFEKSLKMAKQEIKDEYKRSEGDPQVKGRIRQIQRELAKGRMLDAVPDADVVVTNPTHLAVAMQYQGETMDAPKVVAKGAESMAKRIREIASENDVPVVEDKPLARALYKIKIGQNIPMELYEAMAQMLAYVYQLKQGTTSPNPN